MEGLVNQPHLFSNVFKGRTVMITGHTGFKGAWLSLWLHELGARVVGYSLAAAPDSLYSEAGLDDLIESHEGDILDTRSLERVFAAACPDVLFHLAAQSLVRPSYAQPEETFMVNAIGVLRVLEAARKTSTLAACVVATSDKCYENETPTLHAESDPLGGRDPYSASKACAEMIAVTYARSFFQGRPPLATVRAGNVLGGGDWAPERIVPDAVRSLRAGSAIELRNPEAVRPWQFVLEPLSGYLLVAAHQLSRPSEPFGAWNFGPSGAQTTTVSQLIDGLIERWGKGSWRRVEARGGHEAPILQLDSRKAGKHLGWRPVYGFPEMVAATVDWYKQKDSIGARRLCRAQLEAYIASAAEAGLAWTGSKTIPA